MTRHFGVLIPSTNTTGETEYTRLLPAEWQPHYARVKSASIDGSPFSPPLDADVDYQAKLLGTARVEIVFLLQTSASLFSDGYDEDVTRRISAAGGVPAFTSAMAIGEAMQALRVKRIAVVSPKPAHETLAAAHLLGIAEFYCVGGAHAIAALAYGTSMIARVDKIVGPGNLYVTAAKRLVAFDCAIDMLAGPTEIVVTSERGDPSEIAADLVAQAEHDPKAVAIFVTTRTELAGEVVAETRKLSRGNAVAREALGRNGIAIVAADIEEAHAITNLLAP